MIGGAPKAKGRTTCAPCNVDMPVKWTGRIVIRGNPGLIIIDVAIVYQSRGAPVPPPIRGLIDEHTDRLNVFGRQEPSKISDRFAYQERVTEVIEHRRRICHAS